MARSSVTSRKNPYQIPSTTLFADVYIPINTIVAQNAEPIKPTGDCEYTNETKDALILSAIDITPLLRLALFIKKPKLLDFIAPSLVKIRHPS